MSAKDKLVSDLLLGQVFGDILRQKQAEFDAANPSLTKTESSVANKRQLAIKRGFDQKVEKFQKEGHGFSDYESIELRLWAPSIQCAMTQVHDFLQKEFGLFYHIVLSTGLVEVCLGKLFYIAISVKGSNLFSPEAKETEKVENENT